jgi:hypothetical protein
MCPHVNVQLDAWNALEESGEIVERHHLTCERYEVLLDAKYYMMDILDKTNGATMYHADYVTPWWVPAYNFTVKLGDHLFYNDEKTETVEKIPELQE